jgi:hypothetical protein
MATHDHTARARPTFSLGKALSDPSDAYPLVSSPPAHSLRPSTLDDVALALYSLAVLCIEDERHRRAQARPIPVGEPLTWPLPPLFKEGLVVAMQCLEEFGTQLGPRRAVNA